MGESESEAQDSNASPLALLENLEVKLTQGPKPESSYDGQGLSGFAALEEKVKQLLKGETRSQLPPVLPPTVPVSGIMGTIYSSKAITRRTSRIGTKRK